MFNWTPIWLLLAIDSNFVPPGVADMNSVDVSLTLGQLGLDTMDIVRLKAITDHTAWFTSLEVKLDVQIVFYNCSLTLT